MKSIIGQNKTKKAEYSGDGVTELVDPNTYNCTQARKPLHFEDAMDINSDSYLGEVWGRLWTHPEPARPAALRLKAFLTLVFFVDEMVGREGVGYP